MAHDRRRLAPGRPGQSPTSLSGGYPSQAAYRDQALALFPHVCARCGREFKGKDLRELTVHHKDNDHMNNPPNGSNWELLCLYCHDDAHGAYERAGTHGTSTVYRDDDSGSGSSPFQGLRDLLKPKPDEGLDTEQE